MARVQSVDSEVHLYRLPCTFLAPSLTWAGNTSVGAYNSHKEK
jgi:hypothetical protein